MDSYRKPASVYSYNPRISPAPRARTGVTRYYLLCALGPSHGATLYCAACTVRVLYAR